MIKVLCNNPICGKEFYFDEDKIPEAIKIQCQFCKKLQELPKQNILDIKSDNINNDKSIDINPKFENDKLTDVEEEDFGCTVENEKEEHAIAHGINENWRYKINLNKLLFPLLGLLLLIIFILFIYRRYGNGLNANVNNNVDINQLDVYKMPKYQLNVTVDSIISIKKPYKLRLEITPEIDTNTTFYFTINDSVHITSYSNILDVELTAPFKPAKEIPLKILFKAKHDTLVIEDTIIKFVNYVKNSTVKSSPRNILPDQVAMNINLALAEWNGGKDTKEKIVFESNANLMTGSVSLKKNVIIENGERHNAVEVIPGRREGSMIRATIPINKTMGNSSFSMQMAFVKEENKILKVKIEVWAYYGNTSELLIMKIKEQDGKIWNINKKLLSGRTLSHMSIIITKLVSTNKTAGIALMNPKIVSY